MRLAWKLAILTTMVAVGVGVWHWLAPPSASVRVSAAILMLADDPVAWNEDTQTVLRAAAVAAEESLLDTSEAYYVRGMQQQRELNSYNAEGMYRESIDLNPEWSWPYAALGSLIGREAPERLGEAEEVLRRAIALDPEWARPHNSLAVVLRLMGRFKEAEEQALRAIELAPDDIASHNNYANLLVYLGRYGDAEEQYLAARDIDREHPKPYYNLACLYSLKKRNSEAVSMLAEAVRRSDAARRDAMFDSDLNAIRGREDFRELIYGPAPDLPLITEPVQEETDDPIRPEASEEPAQEQPSLPGEATSTPSSPPAP